MCMLLLFTDTTFNIDLSIFREYEHYEIFVLKQNNLLIIKFLSHFLLEKLVNSPKSCNE